MAATTLSGLKQTLCQHLRTKALYVPGGNVQNLAETNPFSNYWCNCTMQVVGPDDGFVSPEACKRSRSCFHAIETTTIT